MFRAICCAVFLACASTTGAAACQVVPPDTSNSRVIDTAAEYSVVAEENDSGGGIAGGGAHDTCASAGVIACGQRISVDLSFATTTGDEPAYTCRRNGAGQGAHNVWFRFTATATSATVRTCGSRGVDSILAVYSGSCGALTQIGCSDDACASLSGGRGDSSANVSGLTVGTQYYIQLGANDEASVGVYDLQVLCPAGSCSVSCPGGAIAENDPTCGGPADLNGGCNLSPPQFQQISCGQTICGSCRFDGFGMGRDTDWYLFTLTQASVVTWSVTAEFQSQAIIIVPGPDPDPCNGRIPHGAATTFGCLPNAVTVTLTPGTYWAYVAPVNSTSQPVFACGDASGDYVATLSCVPAVPGACCRLDGTCTALSEPECQALPGFFAGVGTSCGQVVCCSPNCPAGAMHEDDNPTCASDSTTCSTRPHLTCNARVCGKSGTNGEVRDVDWYLLTLSEETVITWRLTPQFPAAQYLIHETFDPCSAQSDFLETNEPVMPCTTGEIQRCLPAGDYWLFVSTGSVSSYYDRYDENLSPCGSNYVFEVQCATSCHNDPCAGQRRGDTNCDGVVNNFDIDCFVLALTSPALWQAQCGHNGQCAIACVADTNQDGSINNFDIDSFVNCVIHSGCQ